jgi:hypothetical protein
MDFTFLWEKYLNGKCIYFYDGLLKSFAQYPVYIVCSHSSVEITEFNYDNEAVLFVPSHV